jgi:AAA15 family ATPase/GTPase
MKEHKMAYRIRDLQIPECFTQEYKAHENWLENLSKVNIFIGPNNSGKSRFMREMIKQDNLFFKPADFKISDLDSIRSRAYNEIHTMFGSQIFSGKVTDQKNYLKTNTFPIVLRSGEDATAKLREIFTFYKEIKKNKGDFGDRSPEFFQQIEAIGIKYLKELNGLIKNPNNEFLRRYIPVLRGLRPFNVVDKMSHQDNFAERTIKDYFDNKDNPDLIFSGLKMYDKTQEYSRGTLTQRELIAEYQEFLSKNFFNGEEITLIPRIDSDVIYIKVGNEREYPIYNVGDGIQQLIIMTFPLFLHKQQDYHVLAFIEEPELYLHPGLQRRLMEILSDNGLFKNLQCFITTHSNHLLDLTLDFNSISVYKFSKQLEEGETKENKAKFQIENMSSSDLRLLESLGVRNSSVFLSNCTIWVEGISDRYYLRKYLELYQESLKDKSEYKNKPGYKEDIHYSFVEFGGNNITHWSFLDSDHWPINCERLCGRLFLIADKDKKKDERHAKLSAKLGERYYCLKCLEIENLLTPDVINEILKADYNIENSEFEKLTQKEYKDEKLGEFIDKRLKGKINTPAKKFGGKKGIIPRDKFSFARKAIQHIHSVDDMSDEAIKLANKIYEFIAEMNEGSI